MAGMQQDPAMEMESDHSSEEYNEEELERFQQEIEEEPDPERLKQLQRILYGPRFVWLRERVQALALEDGPVLERIAWSPLFPEFVQFTEDEVAALEKECAELKPLAERPSGPMQAMYLAFVMGGHPRLGSASSVFTLSGALDMLDMIVKLSAPLDIAMCVYNLQYSTSIGNRSPPPARDTGPEYLGYRYEHIWWRKVVLKALYLNYNQRTVHVVGGYVPKRKKKFFTLLHQVMWRQADAGEDGVEDPDQEAQPWMWRQAGAGDGEKAAPRAFQRAVTVELGFYRDDKRQLAEILKILTGKKKEGEDAQNNHIIWILNIPNTISAAETRRVRCPATRLYATLKLILQYAAEPYSVVVMKGTRIEDEMMNKIVKDVIVTHEKPDLEQVRDITQRFRNSYLAGYWDDGSFKEFTTAAGQQRSHFLRDFMVKCKDACSTLYASLEDVSRDHSYWLHRSEETAGTHYSF